MQVTVELSDQEMAEIRSLFAFTREFKAHGNSRIRIIPGIR